MEIPGLVLIEHEFQVPLDHARPDGERITVFAREVADPDGAHAGTLSEPAAQEHTIDLRDLQQALEKLDAAHREALTLIAVEGLTYEAAAAIIGCPPGTVKSRVSRARDRLSQDLGQV